jgi:hypothetical protein
MNMANAMIIRALHPARKVLLVGLSFWGNERTSATGMARTPALRLAGKR